jgi:Uma2 family endonuclease
MTTTERLLTAEEFMCLPDNGMQQELVDGKVIEMPPPKPFHGGVQATVAGYLWQFVRPRRLGRVVTESGVVTRRGPDTVRGPDVAFITAGRLPQGRLPDGYFELIPDLIVDIVSPGTKAAAVRARTTMWLDAGAPLVWTLDPRRRTVMVSQPGIPDRTLHAHELLTGDPVLPGFSVLVADLFEP